MQAKKEKRDEMKKAKQIKVASGVAMGIALGGTALAIASHMKRPRLSRKIRKASDKAMRTVEQILDNAAHLMG